MPLHYGSGNVIEAARLAGTDIEDPRPGALLPGPQVHSDDVVHVNEIPHLQAIVFAISASEEPDFLTCFQLFTKPEDHTRHRPLVSLARTVDAEVAQTHHWRTESRRDLANVPIEHQLGKRVDVDRSLAVLADPGVPARAID